MIVNYPDQEVVLGTDSIYLAGLDNKGKNFKSWRKEAVKLLCDIGFSGVVYVPEDRSGEEWPDRKNQIEWEWKALMSSKKIIFWVPEGFDILNPRVDIAEIITNMEFGYISSSLPKRKIFYGYNKPNRFFDLRLSKFGNQPSNNLGDLLLKAVRS